MPEPLRAVRGSGPWAGHGSAPPVTTRYNGTRHNATALALASVANPVLVQERQHRSTALLRLLNLQQMAGPTDRLVGVPHFFGECLVGECRCRRTSGFGIGRDQLDRPSVGFGSGPQVERHRLEVDRGLELARTRELPPPVVTTQDGASHELMS